MGFLMDLVAGETREILLAISVEDWDALDDRSRFQAHLSLGGATDPTWLDLFSEAVRTVTNLDEPRDFLDARRELEAPAEAGDRTIERIDPTWVTAIARLPDKDVDAVAGRWIDLLTEELGDLSREEKPWIRKLSADIVDFCRRADLSPDVILAWSL